MLLKSRYEEHIEKLKETIKEKEAKEAEMSANLKQHVAALDVYKKHLKNKRSMEMKIKKLEEIVESK